MTKYKKNLKTIYIIIICLLISTTVFSNSKLRVEAAGKARKAKNAYSKMLNKKTIRWSEWSRYKTSKMKFACIDVNGDKVPELILQYDNAFGAEGQQRMYTYLNGKVKKKYISGNCDGISEIYPSRKVFINSGGRMGYGWKIHNVFKNGKVTVRAEQYVNIDNNKRTYKVNGKSVGKKKYNAYIKKLLKGKRAKKFVFRKNNAVNRNKYL